MSIVETGHHQVLLGGVERPRQQMEGIGEKLGEVEIVGVSIGTQSL